MTKLPMSYRLILFMLIVVPLFCACDSPPVENVYRKEARFSGSLNVPVAPIVVEWGGKPRVMGSTWLIDGGHSALFSAKHVTDTFINYTIELGANECKVFLAGKVYTCFIDRVPRLRDAVVINLLGLPNLAELPSAYKISTTKLKIGDTVFVQGFHPHPLEITKSNMADGLKDAVIPILKNFYELRQADPEKMSEIVFDSLEAKVVSINDHINIEDQDSDPLGKLKFDVNEYIKVITVRNHKFSFGGLSGGVLVRLNDQGALEAVGIVTAEKPERLEYDEKGKLKGGSDHIVVFDTILITPIESVKDLYEYARKGR